MSAGLYVHFPFCRRKCPYCSFYSVESPSLEASKAWAQALCREALLRAPGWGDFDTLYLGGGTPSLISPAQLELLLKQLAGRLDLSALVEATLEANPDSLSQELLQAAKESGFTRVSLGVQSLSDDHLRRLGRLHSADSARRAASMVTEAGLDLSLDLIFGFKGLSLGEWEQTLEEALRLGPAHISCYAFSQGPSPASPHPASDKAQVDQYELACERLGAAGLLPYEISNFAKPGSESRHNQKYWSGEPYLGLGPAAHSYDGKARWANSASISSWHMALGEWILPTVEREQLTGARRLPELIFSGLRARGGLDLALIEHACGLAFGQQTSAELALLTDEGLLACTGAGRLACTAKGRLYSDALALRLVQAARKEETT
jgi:oxygen-independent coproporphyrinogen-3 oxidase